MTKPMSADQSPGQKPQQSPSQKPQQSPGQKPQQSPGQKPQQSPGQDGKPGLLSRVATRLKRSPEEIEDRQLQDDTGRLGGTPIADLEDRRSATVCGAVRSVTLRPRVNVPALVVELYDGSKTLNLVWLGRRRIGGIVPGTYLTAHGRVTYKHGIPTIFNPSYEIKADRGH